MIWSLLFCLIVRRDDLGSMIECHKLEKGQVGLEALNSKDNFQKTKEKRESQDHHINHGF
jgi:hypothetical protein